MTARTLGRRALYGLTALLVAASISSCGASQRGPEAPRIAEYREAAEDSTDPEVVGRWLFAELVTPDGSAEGAKKARKKLDALGKKSMIADFARGIDDLAHGRLRAAPDHFLSALRAARDSSDPRAPFIAWYASNQALANRYGVPDLWKRWKPFVEQAMAEPRNIGFRARADLVDWWLYEAYTEAQKDIDELAAKHHGCVTKLRIAGPFGRNVVADTLRSFPAEAPGPWPMRWAPDPGIGEAPRVLATTRTGCDVSADEPVSPGIFYGETFVDLRETTEILIVVQGVLRIWADDRLVLFHDPRVWGTWTELAAGVRLGPGRHRLLVQTASSNITVRLLRRDGRPLGVTGSDDASKPYVLHAPEVIDGVNLLDAYVRRGKIVEPTDDLLRFTGAHFASLDGQHDVASVLLEPLLKDPARATGVTLGVAANIAENDPIFASSQRRDLVRELHQRAARKDRELWAARLSLALWEAEKSGLSEGVRHVKPLADAFPEVPAILGSLTGMYSELGWYSEYAASARELARRFPEDPGALEAAIGVYDAEGNTKKADELVEKLRKLDPDNELFLNRALMRQDYATALEELRRIGRRHPERKDIAERVYDVMVRAGNEQETWKKLEAAIEQNPRNERARLDLADAGYAAGTRSALVKALVDAVEDGSSTGLIEDAIDLVEGLSELEPYRLKAQPIIEAYEKSGKELPGTAARILDYAALWVHADGSSRMLEHQIIRVQSAEAVTSMAEQPLHGGLILHMRVIKKDGRILEPELVQEKPTVTMPHLEVGDYIETERIESNPGDGQRGMRYFGPRWFFREENIAYARSEFVVISPKSKPLAIETRNAVPPPTVEENGSLIVRRWRVDQSPAAPVEPFGAPITEFLPSVQIGWGVSLENTIRSMSDAVTDFTPVDPRILRIAERIVAEVPKGAITERAKRLYRWVIANVQEGEESDGRRAIIGKNGNLWRAFITLCRAVGIQVDYVAAQNRLALPPSGPFSEASLFTQPLLRVHTEKEPVWLTLGSKYAPFGYVPADARGVPAYVLSPDRPTLVTTPKSGALDSVLYDGDIRLAADGSAEIELRESFHGKYATGLRSALAEVPEDQLRDVIESRLLGRELRGIELLSHRIEAFDDPDRPLVIHAKGKMAAFAQRQAGTLVLSPPFGPRVSQLAALPSRQTPLLLVEAMHQEIRLRIHLPSGARVESEVRPREVKHGERVVSISDALKADVFSLNRTVNLPAGRIQPEEYPRFVEFARSADEALSQSVRVRVR